MAPVCGTMFSSAACNSPVGLRVAHTNLQSAGLIKVLNRLSGYVSNIYIKRFLQLYIYESEHATRNGDIERAVLDAVGSSVEYVADFLHCEIVERYFHLSVHRGEISSVDKSES